LCVPARSDDTVAPGIVAASVGPDQAGIGETILVDFETDESLLADPVVTLVVDSGVRTLGLIGVEGGTIFHLSYVAVGDEGEGVHDVRVDLVDRAGNVTRAADLGSVTFDFSAPILSDISLAPAVVGAADVAVLSVRVSEVIEDGGSSATVLGGRRFELDPAGQDPLVRRFTLPADAAVDVEGDATVEVVVVEAAGNRATRSLPGALRFDFTAPGIEGDAVVPRPIVRGGQVALLSFRTSETVVEAAVELIPEAGGPSLGMTLDGNAGRDVSFRREVGAADIDGVYRVRVTTLVDEAGNAAAPFDLNGGVLVIDQRAPTFVVRPTSSPPVASLVPGLDLVTVAFTLDEVADVAVRVGTDDVPCSSTGLPPAVAFVCERGTNSADVEGVRGVTVSVIDTANNPAFDTGPSVTYDFTAPVLSIGVTPDDVARGGQVITLSAQAAEVLEPSSLVFVDAGLGFATPVVSGLSATTSLSVPPGLQGAFTVSFQAADLGGNVSGVAQRTLTVDGVPPTLLAPVLSSTRIAPAERFTLSFRTSEGLRGDPLVTFANGDVSGSGAAIINTMTRVSGPDAQQTWLFEGTGPLTGSSPFYTITVVMEDEAGNPGGDNPAVIEVDSAPPQLAGFDIAPLFARNGDTVRVVVTATETLAGPPSLVARNGVNSVVLSPGSVTPGAISYAFTLPIGANTPQGNWTFDGFTMADQAGNAAVIAPSATRTFAVDSQAPSVTAVALSSPVLRDGQALTVTVAVTENAATATATVDGTPMVLLTSLPAANLTFRLTIDDAVLREGLAGITVSVADGAGNVGVAGANVDLDFSVPGVVNSSVTPQTSRAGSVITYALTVDEALASPPVLTVGPQAIPFAFQDGTAFVYAYTVTGLEAQGARTVSAVLTDLAGNSTTVAAPAMQGFAIDSVTPIISSLNVTPAFAIRQAGFNVVSASFTLSEAVGPGLSVTIAGQATACSNVGLNFTCSRTVLGGDSAGTKSVVVQATDAAGNVALATGAVEFDFTPPSLTASNVSPSPANAPDIITYAIATSEPLLGGTAPTLSVGGASPTPFSFVPSTQFSYRYVVTGTESSGPRTVQTTLTDRAGNTATVSGVGFDIDVSVPEILSLSVGATPRLSLNAGFTSTDLVVTIADTPALPTLVVRAGATEVPCSGSGAVRTCTYTATGSEPSAVSVTATATDAAGNSVTKSQTLEFDFTPPAIVGPLSLVILPGSGNPLTSPGAAGNSASIRVGLSLSEPVGTPVLTTTGTSPLAFAVLTDSNPSFQFQHTLNAALPHSQGAQTLQLTATDAVGNRLTTTLSLGAPGLVIDTVRPSVPSVNVDDVTVLERAPWGNTAGATIFRVTGAAGAVEGAATVIGYRDSAAGSAVELGRTVAAANGSYTLTLNGADRPDVFVAVVDSAGNSSDAIAGGAVQATKVRNVAWTASMGLKEVGNTFPNPHTFEIRHQSTSGRVQLDAFEPNGIAALGTLDASSLSTEGTLAFEAVTSPRPPTSQVSMVYDPDHDVVWLPEGSTMFRWDGFRWSTVTPLDPEADGNPPASGDFRFAFDKNTRENVLFTQDGETWVWNGVSWRLAFLADNDGLTAPRPRFRFAMGWDDAEAGILLFGGSDDTVAQATCEDDGACLSDLWLWSGDEWFALAGSASVGGPEPRTGPAMAFDADFGATVVYGGRSDVGTFNDTWVWEGGWRKLATSAGNQRRAHAQMVHDPFLGGLVMFGGDDVNQTLITAQVFFDGSDWSPSPPADPELDSNPTGRTDFGFVYDINRDAWWLFGGQGCFGDCDGMWRGTPSSWRKLGPTEDVAALPGNRSNAAVAFERSRGAIVMHGGLQNFALLSELRLWDGAAWPLRTQSGTVPSARANARMTFDEGQGRTIMFGGRGAQGVACDGGATSGICDGTYILNTTVTPAVWTQLLPATRPSKRHLHSMAYDSTRDRTVLFGGFTALNGTPSAETWEWDTTTTTTGVWSQRCDNVPVGDVCGGTQPPARGRAAMAYDRTRSRTVLFGGDVADDNIYEWNGTSWARILPAVDPTSLSRPTRRIDATLTYDEQRRRFIYFGQADLDNTPCDIQPRPAGCHDLWELTSNGTVASWRRVVTIASPSGDGRPAPRSGHQMVFNQARGESILVGGVSPFETWRVRGGGVDRPAQAFHVDFRSSLLTGGTLRDVAVRWVVGGTASPAGSAINGARISALRDGRLSLLASNTAPATAPASLLGTVSANAANVLSSDDIMTFFAEPTNTSGFGAAHGIVRSDHVEATVRYRLAP